MAGVTSRSAGRTEKPHYADAVRVPAGHDQILVCGTPGLAPDGSLPGDMTGQATQAWRNVQTTLSQAGASLSDIVSVRQWQTLTQRHEDFG